MPAGIEVYNADGTLQFDITNRAFRVLTVAAVGTLNSGTIPVDTTQGALVVTPVVADNKFAPSVSTGVGSVSWDYGGVPAGQRDADARIQIACY